MKGGNKEGLGSMRFAEKLDWKGLILYIFPWDYITYIIFNTSLVHSVFVC